MVNISRVILISFITIITPLSLFAQVAINTTGNPPAPSAMLDIDASNRGFLPPRIELVEIHNPSPVTNPAVGLMVYNTRTHGTELNQVVPGYYTWSGNSWVPVSPPTGINQGDMVYWNGSAWVLIPAGSYGQSLILCNGVPTWGGCFSIPQTDTVTGISANQAICQGTITSDGGTTVTEKGFCWDTNPTPGLSGPHSVNGSGTGLFTHTLSNLTPNTTYFFRAYSTNSKGTSFGSVKSFHTGTTTP